MINMIIRFRPTFEVLMVNKIIIINLISKITSRQEKINKSEPFISVLLVAFVRT